MSADLLFYVTGGVALVATGLALTRAHAVHALLYVIVSLFATATLFFLLGATFVAALEVIVYAGAIMVLFLFVIMMLNLDPGSGDLREQRRLLALPGWIGPALLAAVLAVELIALVVAGTDGGGGGGPTAVGPEEVATALYGPYLIAVELASLLLLAGIVAAYHVARRGPGSEWGDEGGTPGAGAPGSGAAGQSPAGGRR